MKSPLTLVLSIIALVGVVGVPSAFAQSADWNLTIKFINVPNETDYITLNVYGPFSSTAILHQMISNGPDPSTTLTVGGSDVPSGYTYRVCAGATAFGTLFPACNRYTADGNDQTIEITPP